MLRLCTPARACGATFLASTTRTVVTAMGVAALLQPRRGYTTGARTAATERRYYTQPLRAPLYGTSTVVGRQKGDMVAMTAADEWAMSPMAEEMATGLGHRIGVAHLSSTERCTSGPLSARMQWVHALMGRCRSVRYNHDGVPVEGSPLLLPWREQLRLVAAILAALCITKAFFDVVRFELLYYGVWKLGYRNDGSFAKRLLYYGSTAMLAAGLFFSFNVNFFITACIVGRREIAGHMVCDVFTYIMPRRTVQAMASRMGFLAAGAATVPA